MVNDHNQAAVTATDIFHTTEAPPADHHSSHTVADTTPADDHVGEATPTEHSHTTVRATPFATRCSHTTIAEATVAEEDLGRPRAEEFSEEDFCCPICLDLLLRPVVLACGHRLCRGCWCRMLQGREMRATANLTGSASCPLGRCEVKPHVPEVETILEREIEALFSAQRLSRLRVLCLGGATVHFPDLLGLALHRRPAVPRTCRRATEPLKAHNGRLGAAVLSLEARPESPILPPSTPTQAHRPVERLSRR